MNRTPFLGHRKWGVFDFGKGQEGQAPCRDEASGGRGDPRGLRPRRDSRRAGRDRQRREKMAVLLQLLFAASCRPSSSASPWALPSALTCRLRGMRRTSSGEASSRLSRTLPWHRKWPCRGRRRPYRVAFLLEGVPCLLRPHGQQSLQAHGPIREKAILSQCSWEFSAFVRQAHSPGRPPRRAPPSPLRCPRRIFSQVDRHKDPPISCAQEMGAVQNGGGGSGFLPIGVILRILDWIAMHGSYGGLHRFLTAAWVAGAWRHGEDERIDPGRLWRLRWRGSLQ